MRDPRHDEFERLRQRAIELGNIGTGIAYREVLDLLRDIARNPSHKDYVRTMASEAVAAGEGEDVYIEYWGMETPEYVDNMRHKRILYQREGKRLISLYPKDLANLDEILRLKLSRYVRI